MLGLHPSVILKKINFFSLKKSMFHLIVVTMLAQKQTYIS